MAEMAFVGSCVARLGANTAAEFEKLLQAVDVELRTIIPLFYSRLLLNLRGLHLEGHILRYDCY